MSNNSQHTPSPWHLSNVWQKSFDTHGIRLVSGNVSLAEIYNDIPAGEANARLIAAAPEIKEALVNAANGFQLIAHNLRRQIAVRPSPSDTMSAWFSTLASMAASAEQQARAALAKA